MRYAFAHRGGRGHGPDNVIPTFAEALARGAAALETDAWVTADGYVVLDHDGVHRAGTPDEQPITAIARAELADHIPTLDDLYEQCGTGYDLAIDVKGEDAGPAIRDVAVSVGAAERLWLFTPSSTRPGEVHPAHAGVTVRAGELQPPARSPLLDSLRSEGIEVVNARWQFWQLAHWGGEACQPLVFQRLVKKVMNIGAPDEAVCAKATEAFNKEAKVLDAHLARFAIHFDLGHCAAPRLQVRTERDPAALHHVRVRSRGMRLARCPLRSLSGTVQHPEPALVRHVLQPELIWILPEFVG